MEVQTQVLPEGGTQNLIDQAQHATQDESAIAEWLPVIDRIDASVAKGDLQDVVSALSGVHSTTFWGLSAQLAELANRAAGVADSVNELDDRLCSLEQQIQEKQTATYALIGVVMFCLLILIVALAQAVLPIMLGVSGAGLYRVLPDVWK